MQVVPSMAESTKPKSDALEERTNIAVFLRLETANMPETDQFFAAMWQTYLSQALKKARVARKDASAATSDNCADVQNVPLVPPVSLDVKIEVSGASENFLP